MKKVDEIYPFRLNTSIGPTGTIKRLFRNKDFFYDRGYDMSIFALHKDDKKIYGEKGILKQVIKVEDSVTNANCHTKKKGSGLVSLLKSRKHSFIESNYLTSALALHRSLRAVSKLIKNYLKYQRDPDIVVFHDMNSCYYYLKLRKDKRARVVMFVHGDGSDTDMFVKRKPKLEGTREHRMILKQLLYTFENCDKIVWISKLAKERFCKNHPTMAHKAVSVVNGIDDIPEIKADAGTKFKYRLVTTGTVCARKGQYIIVEAMHRINPDILKDTHLTIIGSGPDHAKLVDLCDNYGLQEHVTFVGNIPNKDVPNYLASENIYVLMSNNEGLPISILEAMRAGLPVISTRVAGIPEEVDNRNGILIDPDIEQMVLVLNTLPNYDWHILGLASRKRFEQEFTFDVMRNNYANMFDNLFA